MLQLRAGVHAEHLPSMHKVPSLSPINANPGIMVYTHKLGSMRNEYEKEDEKVKPVRTRDIGPDDPHLIDIYMVEGEN